ncbi:MAG: 30S ribosomal protein S1 [Clostridia bacterium]|nr:30S ribosomal protein S1 [Clostridia bacterium]
MIRFFPEGILVGTEENRAAVSSVSSLTEAMHEGRILEAVAVMCDSRHDLIVELGGVRGVIPREEGAIGIREGTVRDIAVISRVNRPVCFIVTEIERDEFGYLTARLSRRAAQERCLEAYVKKLRSGDVVTVRVTHLEHFGAFADIGCGIPSLLPIDSMSVSRIDHPMQRFSVGDEIRAIVRSNEDGRVCLTHKELLGTWEENAARFAVGQTVMGVVRSVESYGAFIELAPNLAGLSELRPGLRSGMRVSVYIKNIIPQKMKVKLIVIDTFGEESDIAKPEYFYKGEHMNSFRYSPEGCPKIIETIFS